MTSASLDRRPAGRVTPRGQSVFLATYIRYTATTDANLLERPTSHQQTHLPALSIGSKLFPILCIEPMVISGRQDMQLHITSFSYQQAAHTFR